MNIEGAELWIELEMAIGKMIMYPPSETTPISTPLILVGEPWDNDASSSTYFSFSVTQIPNVIGSVPLDARSMAASITKFSDSG